MSEGKAVLLVGATGAVGRPTVAALVAAGHDVRALVRTAERGEVAAAAGATPVVADLFDPQQVVAHLGGVDALVNLATRIPPTARAALPGAWRQNDRLRTAGSTALVDAALRAEVPRYVQESIVFPYADGGDRWLDEDAPLERVAVVTSTEVAERNVARLAAAGGTGVVLRFAMFYGPGSVHTAEALDLVRKGRSPVLGAPDAYQPSIHLADAASSVVAALDVPSGTYNVSDDEPLTKAAYGHAIASAVGVADPKPFPKVVLRLLGKKVAPISRSQRVSNLRFKTASGWAPTYPSASEGWAALASSEASSRG